MAYTLELRSRGGTSLNFLSPSSFKIIIEPVLSQFLSLKTGFSRFGNCFLGFIWAEPGVEPTQKLAELKLLPGSGSDKPGPYLVRAEHSGQDLQVRA